MTRERIQGAIAAGLAALALGCAASGTGPATEAPVAAPSPSVEDVSPEFLPEDQVDVPVALTAPLDPIYPKRALVERREADVTARVAIAADGRLVGLAILDAPDDEFAGAAEEAIRKASFAPARKERGPVASTATLRVRFRLED